MAVIALDLGGTKLAGAVLGRNGKVVVRSLAPLAGRSGTDVGCLSLTKSEGSQPQLLPEGQRSALWVFVFRAWSMARDVFGHLTFPGGKSILWASR